MHNPMMMKPDKATEYYGRRLSLKLRRTSPDKLRYKNKKPSVLLLSQPLTLDPFAHNALTPQPTP